MDRLVARHQSRCLEENTIFPHIGYAHTAEDKATAKLGPTRTKEKGTNLWTAHTELGTRKIRGPTDGII